MAPMVPNTIKFPTALPLRSGGYMSATAVRPSSAPAAPNPNTGPASSRPITESAATKAEAIRPPAISTP